MKKNLFPWIVVASVSLVFFGTAGMFAYWTITGAAWWLRDLSSLLVFAEGMAIAWWGLSQKQRSDTASTPEKQGGRMGETILFHLQLALHWALNKVLMPLGLYVCWLSYFEALEEDASPLTTMPGHECLYKVQLDALRVQLGLMELEKEASALGSSVCWVEGSSFFTLRTMDDCVDLPWTQDGLGEAREIIQHDAATRAESEVTR